MLVNVYEIVIPLMEEQVVKISWFVADDERDLNLPRYKTAGAAGMDVEAGVKKSHEILPGQTVLIPTGFGVSLPEGYELQVRPRSGLAVRHGVTIINSPGTIDSDYRGEVQIGLINLGRIPYIINRGDRIAQLVLAPVVRAVLHEVGELDTTRRDSGGFGHTGV